MKSTLHPLLPLLNLALSAAPPTIDYEPQPRTVILYQQAAFGVIARGTPPFSYQWHKEGMPILGATNDQIVLAQSRFSEAGQYSVAVSNAESGLTSASAGLTVNPPAGGDLDYSFAWGGSINGPIRSVAVQPDGRIMIAGEFWTVNGAVRGNVARLNADGTTDHTFMNGLSGASSSVYSAVVQSDGKILIGGYFAMVNGVNRHGIARLNADGTLDPGFLNGVAGTDVLGVNAIAVQSDGKVVIGGPFSTVNGVRRNRIARLNADGTLDTGFQNGLSGADKWVRAVAVQNDGKILIGGDFATVNGADRNCLARLNADGTLDTSYQYGPPGAFLGANNPVYSVALLADDKAIIAGRFDVINGASRRYIARLNIDGSVDSSFQNGLPGVGPFSGATVVYSVAVQSDGKVVLGGHFSTVNGVNRNGIARLNADGTLDSGFQNGLSGSTDGELDPYYGPAVYSVAVQSDGKVLIGGYFKMVNGESRYGIAQLNGDGTLDRSFQNGVSKVDSHLFGDFYANVNSVAVQSDGKVILGGRFSTVHGVSRNGIARVNADGTLDDGFLNGLAGVNGIVFSVAVQSDGKVLIGGFFTNVNGVARNRIARLNADGTLDGEFQNALAGIGGLSASSVFSVAVQRDGKVLVAGNFYSVNGESRNHIARLNSDGSLDRGFRAGVSGESVSRIAVRNDGKVLIGGDFDSVNGESRNDIAQLNADGTLDSGFQMVSRISGFVSSFAVQSDGRVLIGGSFTNVNGVTRNRIARLNADGTLDTGFQTDLNDSVGSIAVQADRKVLIGGFFTNVNGESRNRIARLNADGTLDRSFQNGVSGANSYVYEALVQSDGKVLIGGFFTIVNGAPAVGFARLWGSADIPPLIKSINRSGGGVNLIWDAIPNRTYRVQYKPNLSAKKWHKLRDKVSAPASGIAAKTDTTLGSTTQRFYRVELLPQ
ncbi:MAG: hypothetical protein L0Y58_24085 [Verrucomicrobia subdivision 3 bacterium]|nr:hypothetical protein [Limisphaerales bacterium]